MIVKQINRLIHFGLQKGLITALDQVYATNLLLGTLDVPEFLTMPIEETLETATPILEEMLAYAVEKNIIEDTNLQRDLFDTKIMNCIMPRPSEVIGKFNALYQDSPQAATDFYYDLSIASNYVRKARTDKNIAWKTATEYGDLDITINLSKPEKDPKDIAKAKLIKSTAYPKCLLCKENEGFFGHLNHPARQTHRIIPLNFNRKAWFLQYSPYVYYNEHCIVLNSEHIPMKISRETFENLLAFLEVLPHYIVGSNADLPIVGGSILSHDHYQGGRYTFAMETAAVEETYCIKGYEDISVGRVKWPLSVLRLRDKKKEKLIELADHILTAWRNYSDETVEILANSKGEPHNTITPIARMRGDAYEFDLVLRNNRSSQQHPLGIFHPHSEVHHIKKENIGLIEVLGLAILPARLEQELKHICKALLEGIEDISQEESIGKHAIWYQEIRTKYAKINVQNVDEIVQKEVGLKFLTVLSHAGVFKRNEIGIQAFNKFVESL
ncbi:MAG: galactose-phosphate uridylyltransferase [Firmicutes bacterium]|nr:galactose-phosphate uridylyltransferase [Bacillota bacterium]